MNLYGEASGNELYHIRLGDSKLFHECAGMSFSEAVFRSFPKNVCLIAVKSQSTSQLEINPGSSYIMVWLLNDDDDDIGWDATASIIESCSSLDNMSASYIIINTQQHEDDVCFYLAQTSEALMIVTEKRTNYLIQWHHIRSWVIIVAITSLQAAVWDTFSKYWLQLHNHALLCNHR